MDQYFRNYSTTQVYIMQNERRKPSHLCARLEQSVAFLGPWYTEQSNELSRRCIYVCAATVGLLMDGIGTGGVSRYCGSAQNLNLRHAKVQCYSVAKLPKSDRCVAEMNLRQRALRPLIFVRKWSMDHWSYFVHTTHFA